MDSGSRHGASFTPYGPWATLGLAAGVFIGADLLAQMLVFLVSGASSALDSAGKVTGHTLAAMIFGDLLGIAAIIKLADLRAPGRAADYLALGWPDSRTAWRWLGITAGYLLAQTMLVAFLRSALGIPSPVTPLDGVPLSPLLALAVVVLGPIYEELFFRGFLLEGLAPTRLGWAGAMVVSTLGWTMLHYQYDLLGLVIVFGCGMIFGIARLASGSLLLSMALHVAFNALTILLALA